MMAVEKTQSDVHVSRLADRNVVIGEEDEDQNIRFSISIAQLIEAALEREIANKPKRTILITSRSVRSEVSDRDSDIDTPQSSPGTTATDKNGRGPSPPLGIEEDINGMHLLNANGDTNKESKEEGMTDGASPPPRLPIKLVMKNRYRLPQEDSPGDDSSSSQDQAALDLTTKYKSTHYRHDTVLKMATSQPTKPGVSHSQTIDINPDMFSQCKNSSKSLEVSSSSVQGVDCPSEDNAVPKPADIKLDVLDYHMLKSLSSIESPNYIAKNKNVRTKLTSAHRNYLKYSELVERIIEKKMEPPSQATNEGCSSSDSSNVEPRFPGGMKRQLSTSSEVASSYSGTMNIKSARCEASQASQIMPNNGSRQSDG